MVDGGLCDDGEQQRRCCGEKSYAVKHQPLLIPTDDAQTCEHVADGYHREDNAKTLDNTDHPSNNTSGRGTTRGMQHA